MTYCRTVGYRIFFKVMFLGMLLSLLIYLSTLVEEFGKREVLLNVFFGVMVALYGFVCWLFGLLSVWHHRKYQLLPEGIAVAYDSRKPVLIPWNKVTDVAYCFISRKRGKEQVIRVAFGEAFNAKDDPYGIWQNVDFTWQYHKYILIIDDTEEARHEFQKKCPIPVRDLLK